MHCQVKYEVFGTKRLYLRPGQTSRLQPTHDFLSFEFEDKTPWRQSPVEIDHGKSIVAHKLYFAVEAKM